MKKTHVHILTAVNSANVSKDGGMYTIKDVCGAVDDIVMNGALYPAEQLKISANSLEGKPAPAGHPMNANGQYISALSGDALLGSYAGAVCTNARHEGGRTVVDIKVNEAQAKAHKDGLKLIERLDAAIAQTNSEPIHVSTGLLCKMIQANGESRGKPYKRIATNIEYDHLAILMNEKGAGTPDDGVGMFLNAQGEAEQVEVVECNHEPEDKRKSGFLAWLTKLVGNGDSDISFDTITSKLYDLMQEGAWIREVYDRYAIWTDKDGRMYRQDYSVGSDASVAFTSEPVEVTRKVEYETVNASMKGVDPVKEQILSALNKAGIKTEGLTDDQLLGAYNQLQVQPITEKLTAANSKLAEIEANAKQAEAAEVESLAKSLAVNSVLTVDDYKTLPLARLKELSANKSATPVTPAGGAGAKPHDDLLAYDINATLTQGGDNA